MEPNGTPVHAQVITSLLLSEEPESVYLLASTTLPQSKGCGAQQITMRIPRIKASRCCAVTSACKPGGWSASLSTVISLKTRLSWFFEDRRGLLLLKWGSSCCLNAQEDPMVPVRSEVPAILLKAVRCWHG